MDWLKHLEHDWKEIQRETLEGVPISLTQKCVPRGPGNTKWVP